VHLSSNDRLDDKQFYAKFAHLGPEAAPQKLIKSELLKKVNMSDYRPGESDRFLQLDHAVALNTWRDGGVEPQDGYPTIILEHLGYLISNEDERNHVLNVLAYCVQHPAIKVKHALVIGGKQGTGKSFLAQLLSELGIVVRNIATWCLRAANHCCN
jgi:hypothetical protein